MGLVAYFEIPVGDLDRAVAFYERLLGVQLERTVVDGHPMALFPPVDGVGQATGALAAGARVLYPPTSVGDTDTVAELEDPEGNRIALLSRS